MKLKAVITAAAPGQRHILDQTLTTHDGKRTRIIEFLLELVSGIADQVAFILPAGAGASWNIFSNNSQIFGLSRSRLTGNTCLLIRLVSLITLRSYSSTDMPIAPKNEARR